MNNVIISENIISKSQWSSAFATECSDGSAPVSNQCPSGTTPVFNDHPAADAANAYCTGCRLMTHVEANSWCGPTYTANSKCIAKYNGSVYHWWLSDTYSSRYAWFVYISGYVGHDLYVISSSGVRPAVSIPAGAIMSGSGTKLDPYVITVN